MRRFILSAFAVLFASILPAATPTPTNTVTPTNTPTPPISAYTLPNYGVENALDRRGGVLVDSNPNYTNQYALQSVTQSGIARMHSYIQFGTRPGDRASLIFPLPKAVTAIVRRGDCVAINTSGYVTKTSAAMDQGFVGVAYRSQDYGLAAVPVQCHGVVEVASHINVTAGDLVVPAGNGRVTGTSGVADFTSVSRNPRILILETKTISSTNYLVKAYINVIP